MAIVSLKDNVIILDDNVERPGFKLKADWCKQQQHWAISKKQVRLVATEYDVSQMGSNKFMYFETNELNFH